MDEDESEEDTGFTFDMIVGALIHLMLDTLLVFFLWNYALVGSIEGVHHISAFTALGIIFLARSISRG